MMKDYQVGSSPYDNAVINERGQKEILFMNWIKQV